MTYFQKYLVQINRFEQKELQLKKIFSKNTFRSNKYFSHFLSFYRPICTISVKKKHNKNKNPANILLRHPPVRTSKSILNVIDQTPGLKLRSTPLYTNKKAFNNVLYISSYIVGPTISYYINWFYSKSCLNRLSKNRQSPRGREYNNLPFKMHCDSIITRSCWIVD